MNLVRMIHDQTSFTLDLYKQVWRQMNPEEGNEAPQQKNAVLSPLSISMALAMAAAGAKGQTLEQICSVVKLPTGPAMHDFSQQLNSVLLGGTSTGLKALFKSVFERKDKDKDLVCSVANGVWVEESLKLRASYSDTIKKQYRAEVRAADFIKKAEESRKMINSWVSEKTIGKIPELLPTGSVDDQSRLVLTNAVYFKGAWQKEFDKSDTHDAPFFLPNGETVQVPMMTTIRKKQFFKNHGTFKVLRLPYQPGSDSRSFSLYVLLPSEKNGLPQLVKSLESAEFLGSKLTAIGELELGRFQLPKFKITLDLNAQKLLKGLGLDVPFSSQADFSGMVESASPELFISDVFHKAFVEVNEQGTEAAAASAVIVTARCLPLAPAEEFVADHPFLFLIREDTTGIVLFIGHVDNPSV